MGRYLIGLAASIFPLLGAACGDARQVRNDSAASNSACGILPGRSETIEPTKAGIQYFPLSFGKAMHICNFKGYPECFPKIGKFENEWYSEHWEAAQEPSLYEISNATKTTQGSVIRFTWLPTFHHPVIVRFDISADSINVIAKELSGAGGYQPGTISRQINRKLDPVEVRQVTGALAKASPFNEPPLYCEQGLDGSQWMLERAAHDSYDFANRFSPQKGAMRDFGLLALKLTRWKFEEIY